MQEDLRRALKKPMEERRWGSVLDLRKCVGCHACNIACIAENKLPPGVVYRPVIEEQRGTFPNVSRRFVPKPCVQCDNPPCTPVCPVGATWKQSDGIVVIDYERCIGCRYCLTACPYTARTFDFGEYYAHGTHGVQPYGMVHTTQPYEKVHNFEYGKRWVRVGEESPIGNARKCHYCIHRLNKGMLPACISTCIARAKYFGDLNDPESLVSKLKAKPNVFRLKEELGTNPKTYYLM